MTELGIEVLEYLTEDGRNLFRTWLEALRDAEARARIRVRINRIRLGNFGDSKSVGGGVSELRIPYGPGYRVYFGRQGNRVVILLCGGDKRTQARDIETARVAWQDYVKRSTSA
ncbi:MAG: type II toxin-antitoxin system RelE/ParE family toxin [Caldilinea sp.]|nr:type II toxin-antitoxin system RelE/ParE family toxin [Caldilinea sp.]